MNFINIITINKDRAHTLIECLTKNWHFNQITLSFKSITDNDIWYLNDYLKSDFMKLHQNLILSNLVSLNLRHNIIGDYGVEGLNEILKETMNLTELYLDSNQIKDEGCRILSDFLMRNRTLTTLNINRNEITESGIKALSNSLKLNNTLISLGLECNKFGDSGGQFLGEVLKINSTLTSLDLEFCGIGEPGMCYLIEGLDKNYTIGYIFTWGNPSERLHTFEVNKRLEDNRSGDSKKYMSGKLLLLCHYFEEGSLFHRDNLPLDIFKIIFKLSGLFLKKPLMKIKKRKIENLEFEIK